MRQGLRLSVVTAVLASAAGCLNPLDRQMEDVLHEQVRSSQRSFREAVSESPVVDVLRERSDVELKLTKERRQELDKIGGPRAYEGVALDLGSDLMGSSEANTVRISLRQAVQMAARNNLDVKVAQVQPAIRQAQITQAEAAFDAVFFTDFNFQKTDTPFPPTNAFVSSAFGTVQEDTRTLVTGIRKPLSSGGQLTVSNQMGRNRRLPSFFSTNQHYDSNILLSLAQPLLRNFGEDVSRAQIMLTRNARGSDLQQLRRQLLDVVDDTETEFWNLVLARYTVLFRQRLLKRTQVERDKIEARLGHDATPVEFTQANSVVESTRADLIRAVNQTRSSSDRLKRLMNSPDMTVADELLLVPIDLPTDLPVKFNLLDAVMTAMKHRPEIQQALLQIRDASIRQRVADNARLPQLDLTATIRYNGIGANVGEAQEIVTDAKFIDYLVGMQFEAPFGNRRAESAWRESQLNKRGAVTFYQREMQRVVLEVKLAMRAVIDAFRLIDAERGSRLAAADNVRALDEREKAGEAQTPDFIDRRLRSLQALSGAEAREIQGLTTYQIAISRLYQAMGTLLERNGIEFSHLPVEG